MLALLQGNFSDCIKPLIRWSEASLIQEKAESCGSANGTAAPGKNNVIIQTHGTVARCFPMYSASFAWGDIDRFTFNREQLDDMKQILSKRLLLHAEPQSCLLLQRRGGDQVDGRTSSGGFRGDSQF